MVYLDLGLVDRMVLINFLVSVHEESLNGPMIAVTTLE